MCCSIGSAKTSPVMEELRIAILLYDCSMAPYYSLCRFGVASTLLSGESWRLLCQGGAWQG